jgi:hypothetical protein
LDNIGCVSRAERGLLHVGDQTRWITPWLVRRRIIRIVDLAARRHPAGESSSGDFEHSVTQWTPFA